MKHKGTFCGSHLEQCPQSFAINVSQEEFAEKMGKPKLRTQEQPHLTINAEETSSLKSVLGAGLWLAKETRPDLAVQVSQGQQLLPSPTLGQAKAKANISRRAKQRKNLVWKILPITQKEVRLCVHTDAAFANAKRQGTQAGYIVGITTSALKEGKTAPWSPAVWKSYRLKRVVGSTLAGETQALADGLGHTEWLACHLAEVKHFHFSLAERSQYIKEFGIQAITDCKSVYDHLQAYASPRSVGDKRVAIDLVIVKEALKRMWGPIRWAPTWLQLADALTKENADAMDILRGAMKTTVYHLNNESVMLQSAAEQRALRSRGKTTNTGGVGSEVLLVSEWSIDEIMVKVPTKGCDEVEIRALFEAMVECYAKSEDECQKSLTQTRASCRCKLPLSMVNSKGENGLVTFTYTKNTDGDHPCWGSTLRCCGGHLCLCVGQVQGDDAEARDHPHGGRHRRVVGSFPEDSSATSRYLDDENVKTESVKGEGKPPIAMTQALTPQDEEFTAAIAELCHEGSGLEEQVLAGDVQGIRS